ncbi:unnamed protein product [Rangifer tarandus platyrhynchus]|uniref:Uncharacterized protein n=2 Tax=Rangifer tarandus platyrhynchus TaxID=3082113 RepID=A0ACB0F9A4_RANTA|nr:unnamed protein product [Rangifer tarandus platyrhynchus]CAI9709372.1 unnamed protein product [Rangifer tarandus platyrhynchus]
MSTKGGLADQEHVWSTAESLLSSSEHPSTLRAGLHTQIPHTDVGGSSGAPSPPDRRWPQRALLHSASFMHLILTSAGEDAPPPPGWASGTALLGEVGCTYLPARCLLPHTPLAAGESVALTTRGSAHTALPPKRDTQASLPWEHEWSSPFGPGRAGSELTARGQMRLLQASGALAIGREGGYRHLVDRYSLTWF